MKNFNRCPHCFQTLENHEVTWEMIMGPGWDIEKLNDRTVIGEASDFIKEHVKSRNKHLKKTDSIEHYFIRKVDEFKEFMDKEENNGEEWDDIDEEEEADGKIRLTLNDENPNMLFYEDDNGQPVIYMLPCCPKCNARFPIGWQEADDFLCIGMVGSSEGGKTTALESAMYRNWEALKGNLEIGGTPVDIESAHQCDDPRDEAYYEMQKRSEQMCCYKGECVDHTNTEFWIPPIFLKVNYKEKLMIVGIYDNSGENLTTMDAYTRPDINRLMKNIYAEIFMFKPENLNIDLLGKDNRALEEKIRSSYLIDLEDQGNFQIEHPEKIDAAKILADKEAEHLQKKTPEEINLYTKHISKLKFHRSSQRLKNIYFLGVLGKSDLLKDSDVMQEHPEYAVLFDRNDSDMMNRDAMLSRSKLVEQMIQNLNLFDPKYLDMFENDFAKTDPDDKRHSKAVTWYCNSSLGCATKDGRLTGEYNPIRVAEPFLACIYKRIMDNEW